MSEDIYINKKSSGSCGTEAGSRLAVTPGEGRSIRVGGVSGFDLRHTFDCGQCFRWTPEEDGSYTGVAGGRAVNVAVADDGTVVIDNCTAQEFWDFWYDYFDFGRDYSRIRALLSGGDPVMARAAEYGSGIKLLQQDIWETVISFIISQNSNIPRIRRCIETLCESYGDKIGIYKGKERFAFPSPQRLAQLCAGDLAACRLGYRDKYIVATATAVAADGGRQLAALRSLPTVEAETYLRSLHGVGPKVANCILLFGALKYDSFPVDVWMRRVMSRLYGFDEGDIKGMHEYAAARFGAYSGFAQQYLFFYARENMNSGKEA